MEQPGAGSFWKDRYATHPGAGATEPKSSFRDYWDKQRASHGFGGVQPMGGHHGGPEIADAGGYGPPGSRPAIPNPGAGGVSMPNPVMMDGPQRPQRPAPGGGMMTPGIQMDGPQPAPFTRPPVMAPGGGGGGMTPPLGRPTSPYDRRDAIRPRPVPLRPVPVPPRAAPGGRGGGFGGVRPGGMISSRAIA